MTANIKTHLSELVEFLEKKVPYASALYKKKQGTRISVNRVQESVEQEDPAEGLVFNLWNGQSFFEYSSNDTHWSKIKKELTGILQQAVKSRDKHLPSYEINPGLKLEKSFVSPFKIDPSTIHTFEKLKLTRNLMQTALQSDPSVSNAVSIFNNVTSEDIFVNRNKRLSQKIIRSDVIVVVFVSDGQNMVDLHTGKSKNGGMDSVSISPEEIKRLVEDGKVLVKAKRLSPGLYDTITDSEWSGIIAHECFGHGVETDLYTRGRAKSQSYIGKPVASSIVNMFDDPSQISEAGGFFFDDEGELSSPTQVIQDNILKSKLTNLTSSQTLKIKRTTNKKHENFTQTYPGALLVPLYRNSTGHRQQKHQEYQIHQTRKGHSCRGGNPRSG
jgi:TldD protein